MKSNAMENAFVVGLRKVDDVLVIENGLRDDSLTITKSVIAEVDK